MKIFFLLSVTVCSSLAVHRTAHSSQRTSAVRSAGQRQDDAGESLLTAQPSVKMCAQPNSPPTHIKQSKQ